MINNTNSFRCEYRVHISFIPRLVKFKVEIIPDHQHVMLNNQVDFPQKQTKPLQFPQYKIYFSLISGKSCVFQTLCLHIYQLVNNQYVQRMTQQQPVHKHIINKLKTSPIPIQNQQVQQQPQQLNPQSPRFYPSTPPVKPLITTSVLKTDQSSNLSSTSSTSSASTPSSSSQNVYKGGNQQVPLNTNNIQTFNSDKKNTTTTNNTNYSTNFRNNANFSFT